MKYLILLLFAFNLNAAVKPCIKDSPCKVEIVRNDKVTNAAKFDTKKEAKAWVRDNEKILKGKRHRNSFGLVDRWLKSNKGDDSLESRATALSDSDEEGNNSFLIEYKHLQNYEVIYDDLTGKKAEEKSKKAEEKSKKAEKRAKIKALKKLYSRLDDMSPVGEWRVEVVKVLKYVLDEIKED